MPLTESSRLLKADAVRSLGSRIIFNFDDLRARCEEYLESVRGEASRILAEAHAAAVEIHAAAAREGHQKGYRDGLDAARDTVQERIEQRAEVLVGERLSAVIPLLQRAVAALTDAREEWLRRWERGAIELCAAMAETVVRREIARRPELAAELVRDALQMAAGGRVVALRMHPDDVAHLGRQQQSVLELFGADRAKLVPDPSVGRGGCIAETEQGCIDARLGSQFARIVDELSPPAADFVLPEAARGGGAAGYASPSPEQALPADPEAAP